MRGWEFAELAAFVAVAQERSFRGAAAKLGASPSALSRTIRSLEARVGARLLNRTTRSVAPTEAGRALFSRIQPAITDMEGAVRDIGVYQQLPKGTVRINLPRIAARLVIEPILGDFAERYPEVLLDLVIDDNITDVVAEGFDAGVRAGERVQQDMVAVRLTPDLRMTVVGAPEYFATRPLPKIPADLREHACITYKWHPLGKLYPWRFHGDGGPVEVQVENILTANDTDLLLHAALRGAGLAFLPETLVAPYVEKGALVRALDDWCRPFSGFYIYYPDKTHMPAALRAFVDFVKSSAG